MATSQKNPKLLTAGKWRLSTKQLLIAGSVALNIGFVVLWLALATTNVLDGVFMPNGLERYCASANDDKFNSSSDQVKALRNYVCDRGDAHQFFQEGLTKYYDAKGIVHATNE